jgi:CRISPR-associated RAMP protein (TIGR02581 family)
MVFWTSSSILLREMLIRGYITNIEPLRIGVGKEAPLGSLVDLAVLRINYGGRTIPVIPGSSLKGVFRSTATAILRSLQLRACSGLSRENCMDTVILDQPYQRSLGEAIESLLRMGKTSEAMELFYRNACLLCKIFGAPSYSSKITFSDAYPLGEDGEILPFSFNTRTGIAIDRRTGAVFRGALYTVEFIEPGARFRFLTTSRNLPNYALGLISTIIRMVNSGEVKVGGFKTRGFGAVRIDKLSLKVRDYPRSEEPILKPLDDKDQRIELTGLVRMENGWLVAEDENAWSVLERLEDAWYGYAKS